MTCEEVAKWLIEAYNDVCPSDDEPLVRPGEEGAADIREDIRQHIEGCSACAAMEKELHRMEQLMTSTPEVYPGPGLEQRFREMLHTAEQEQKAARPVVRSLYVWRNIAAAVILLALGIGIGVYWSSSSRSPAPLVRITPVAHRGDSADNRLFTLLGSASASERIEAVNYAETVTAPDQKVMDALINTLDHDKNVNVRLACVYSLSKFADNPKVREAMVSSLSRQTEPIVQIVLINMLTEMKESRAIRPLRDIISNDKISKEVKNAAEKGLRVM